MIASLALLGALQAAGPEELERERIRSKIPLTAEEMRAYETVEAPAVKRPPAFSLCVIPLSFADRTFDTTDLKGLFFGRLAAYARAASGGKFELVGRIYAPVNLEVGRAGFREGDVQAAADSFLRREGSGAMAAFDGVAFVAAGPLGARGSPLWPFKSAVCAGDREVGCILLAEEADGRELGIAAHEFMHLLGLDDKYGDERTPVGKWCIMGTGYASRDPAPPCASCRRKLGWCRPADVDPRRRAAIVMDPDPARIVRIPLNADGTECLLLEMRDRLLVWHEEGAGRIELVGRFPSEASDRLTPFSDPPFRGRTAGARPVWITDIRIQDGKAWFRIGPDAPLTPLEERRRAAVGRRIGED